MKTLKHTLFVALMLTSFSYTKAQCIWAAYASPNGANVQFYSYVDSTTMPATYYWEFGDGDTAQELYPQHTYAQSGDYTYCFHYSSFLCTMDSCGTVHVDFCNFNPQVSFSNNGLTATLGVSNPPAGATYNWIIYTGGSPVTSTDPNPVVTFPNWGVFTAHVDVTLPNSCVDTAMAYLYLNNPCTSYFYYGLVDSNTVQFYPSPYDSVNTNHFTYGWTFGDGGSSSDYVPTHDYANYNSYNVCLTVSDSNCTDTYCQQINIIAPPPPTYTISGSVQKGGSPACSDTIYLIREDSVGYLSLAGMTSSYFTVDSFGQHCTGSYYFSYLQPGVYYVKAGLDSMDADYVNYLPTYYGDVLNWSSATAINVNSNQSNVDIHLIAGINPGGPGFIGGWVSQGAGLVIGGGGGSRGVGDPLPGLQVNLLTVNDVPVSSAHTDANGRYTFNNLALGTYKVYVEEINKVPYPLNVTLTGNNPTQDNVNVSVNSNSATTGLDDVSDIQMQGIFPNPITDKTTVTLSLKQNAKVSMTLTDLTGRVLQYKNLDLNTGTNEIILDLASQAAGVYHLSLTNGADKKILKLVKVK